MLRAALAMAAGARARTSTRSRNHRCAAHPPVDSYPATVNVTGYTGATAVTVKSYGIGATDVTTTTAAGTGTAVTVTVPPYSLTALVF